MDHADGDPMAVFADSFILPEAPAALTTPPSFFERFAPEPRLIAVPGPRRAARCCARAARASPRGRPAVQPNYIYWMLVLIIVVLVAILLARPVIVVSGAPAPVAARDSL